MQLLLPPSLFLLTLLLLSTSSPTSTAAGYFHGRVIVVDKWGRGHFRTVQAAVDSVPSNNARWIKIQINAGTYVEKVQIPADKPYIILQGKDRRTTTISYYGHGITDLSATFSSFADNIVAVAVTFKNSFNLAAAMELFDSDKQAFITQAVAARIYGDKSAFFWCGFEGVQDTLWDVKGRHYYKHCYIKGAIDFIFGAGQSVFEDCDIYANVATVKQIEEGSITAQSRSTADSWSGFVFLRGRVMGSGRVLLGRAYGPYSRVIFYQTWLGSVVSPQGWHAWHFLNKEYNLVYAEVGCRGPGSWTGHRVLWEKKFKAYQIRFFSVFSFINRDRWIEKILRL